MENTNISGVIFEHDDGTFEIWAGELSSNDKAQIIKILSKYQNEGASIRGELKEISLSDVIGDQ